MDDEHRKILEMVIEGKLTPEQASQFLEALTGAHLAEVPQSLVRASQEPRPTGLSAEELLELRPTRGERFVYPRDARVGL